MPGPLDLDVRTEIPLLIAFADLTRYRVQSRRLPDAELAEVMNTFYEKVSARISGAGGTVVKFIGDASLIVFPEPLVDAGVSALLSLKDEIDAWFEAKRWEPRLQIKIHYGAVIAGPYGAERRFDILGNEVNTAATLESTGLALSTQAFRKLSPELRRRFKKHTPPLTYIRVEDPHPR
jgi:class 3 adenylate cyclase